MAGNFTKVIAKDADFDSEVLKAPGTVLAYFSATWSGPAKAMAPVIDKIGQDYPGDVKVVKVDITHCTQTTKKYGIKSIPTILVFRHGEKVRSHIGLTSRENILKLAHL